MPQIKTVNANWILDSRGLPTVNCEITLETNNNQIFEGMASVPSGASTGTHEALELRDGGKDFGGKGVKKAINNILEIISPAIVNMDFGDAASVDKVILALDNSGNKSILGANAILGVSMAVHRAFSQAHGQELWEYLRDLYFVNQVEVKMPRLMCNIINGGAHADSGLSIQEFMVVPKTSSLETDVQMISEVYQTLKSQLKKDGYSTALGDEGGFAPRISSSQEVLEYINSTIATSSYTTDQYDLALDCAASEFYNPKDQTYTLENKVYSKSELVNLYEQFFKNNKVFSIEDGLAEDDIEGWKMLKLQLASNSYSEAANKLLQIGDDLFVTNRERFEDLGLKQGLASGILIKLNQIGSVFETCAVINLAKNNGYITAVSHRSGETVDDFMADLAVACNSEFIKLGAPARGERVSKYNRLLQIQRKLDDK